MMVRKEKCPNDPITIRIGQLQKRSKPELTSSVKQSHRVFDARGLSKGELISYVLEAEFGERKLREWGERCT